ncbi:hypothetical protein MAPG_04810 [Magnaporthiopsis poae ATCC 64411]|uniref:FAS1 domain-containing protein n=1 Tax=Magnaporthiopsis poae (strain ATCC 64411 / 73-15) TaxID=644358 RepID=A0A0C4DXQ6_MAGP6|nr:hypothetical protein MAPG_04810 [Magnaporthiopsis poae ATCC 64411]
MRLHTPTLLASCASLAAAQSGSLQQVLDQGGLTDYADLLQKVNSPLLTSGNNLIIYATINAAFDDNNSTIKRRDEADEAAATAAIQASNSEAPASTSKRDTSSLGSSPGSSLGCGPGVSRVTFLNDPRWVNLGPGRNQTVVEKQLPSSAGPVVIAGFGDGIRVTGADLPFDRGVVRPIADFFKLPGTVSQTLPFVGAEKFKAALEKAGILPGLDNTTAITVLAPSDSVFGKLGNVTAAQLKQHIIVGRVVYSTQFRDGQVLPTLGGGSVTVSVQGGVISVGGARIVASDAIIKNGVIHTIDRPLTPATPTTPVPSTVPTAAGATVRPLAWQLATAFGLVAFVGQIW